MAIRRLDLDPEITAQDVLETAQQILHPDREWAVRAAGLVVGASEAAIQRAIEIDREARRQAARGDARRRLARRFGLRDPRRSQEALAACRAEADLADEDLAVHQQGVAERAHLKRITERNGERVSLALVEQSLIRGGRHVPQVAHGRGPAIVGAAECGGMSHDAIRLAGGVSDPDVRAGLQRTDRQQHDAAERRGRSYEGRGRDR